MGYPKLEYKYLYHASQYDALREALTGMCELDPYARRTAEGRYTIRSVYFDSRDFAAYGEKVEGVRVRRKFRIRTYGEHTPESVAFLEIKRKDGVLLTKYRAPLLYDNLPAFFRERDLHKYVRKNGGDGVDREHARRWLYHYVSRDLKPVVLITYERTAMVGAQNFDLRVTLDCNLRASTFPRLEDMHREDILYPSMKNFGIIEVKFTSGVPRWLRDVIHDFDLPRMALSKYTIALDAKDGGPLNTGQTRDNLRRSSYASRFLTARFITQTVPVSSS